MIQELGAGAGAGPRVQVRLQVQQQGVPQLQRPLLQQMDRVLRLGSHLLGLAASHLGVQTFHDLSLETLNLFQFSFEHQSF